MRLSAMMKTLLCAVLLTIALFNYVELCSDDKIDKIESAHPDCLQTFENSLKEALTSNQSACSDGQTFFNCLAKDLTVDCQELAQQRINSALAFDKSIGLSFSCNLTIGPQSKAGLKEVSLLGVLSAFLTVLIL